MRTSRYSVEKIRPRRSSVTFSCSRVKPSTYTAPAQMPMPNVSTAETWIWPMLDEPARHRPAATNDQVNTRVLLRCRWPHDTMPTPVATPRPSAVMRKP